MSMSAAEVCRAVRPLATLSVPQFEGTHRVRLCSYDGSHRGVRRPHLNRDFMAKVNYSHQKKQREQAAKKKRDEKLQRRQQRKDDAPQTGTPPPSA